MPWYWPFGAKTKKAGSKKDSKAKEKPKPNDVTKKSDVVVEEVPEATPVLSPQEALGATAPELLQRLHGKFPHQRYVQAALFYLLRLSQAKNEWRGRPVGMINKQLIAYLKSKGQEASESMMTISRLETDGFIMKIKLGEKIAYKPSMMLIRTLASTEEDYGFALTLDDDATVVAEEGEEVVILDEETTELFPVK